jgi:hypothetical protein
VLGAVTKYYLRIEQKWEEINFSYKKCFTFLRIVTVNVLLQSGWMIHVGIDSKLPVIRTVKSVLHAKVFERTSMSRELIC